jgi:hypothetical protein
MRYREGSDGLAVDVETMMARDFSRWLLISRRESRLLTARSIFVHVSGSEFTENFALLGAGRSTCLFF